MNFNMNFLDLQIGSFSIIYILLFILLIYIFLYWQNYGITTTKYRYKNKKLPKDMKGYKIVQISDYHNTVVLHEKVLNLTSKEKPDIIVITGDLFDCRKTDIETGLNLLKDLVKISPVYYVTGNHEARIGNIDNIKMKIEDIGVKIIEDKKISIWKGKSSITLMGIADPQFFLKDKKEDKHAFRNHLLNFTKDDDSFKILLSHRPEFIHTYRDSGVDLVFTGHAHGGQFRIPFTNIGVFVPNQGIFPPYASGIKTLDETTVVISRGIGNSVFPFRLFNRPEIVTVEF